MDFTAMRSVPSSYEKAVKELARRKAEQTLACDNCGRANRPGHRVIEIEENDDAHCPCGNIFNVQV